MVLIIGTERVTNKSMINAASSRQRMSSRRSIMVMVKVHYGGWVLMRNRCSEME